MNKGIIIAEQGEKAYSYISTFFNIENNDVEVVKTTTVFNIKKIEPPKKGIVNLNKINDIKDTNLFFSELNNKLIDGGIFIGCVETKVERRKRIYRKYPIVIAQIYYFFDFIFKRVFSKLFFTKWLYFFVTAGRNQVLSKAEALGRVAYAGFEILDDEEINNLLYFVAKKQTTPSNNSTPRFSLLFKMQRVGKNNKLITVYKIRTMHPYAEYLQDYLYKKNQLQKGGKFKDDYRITSWGRVFRKLWIDELPMLYNLLISEIKLVGVRPISTQYLSLYTEELKTLRKTVKPGLIPPFYADMPETLDEIIASEINYINTYKKKPLRTDFNYFFKALGNILFKRVRSN
ncbi:MAG: sugar transferase [Flavobacteriales bacterium]|nr:sugar transferase [Flavobacteriales bacterium]